MTKLEHLTNSHIRALYASCDRIEREFITDTTGSVVRAPTSTEASYRDARVGLRDTLAAMADEVVMELLAIMWLGRGDSGSTLSETLTSATEEFDIHTRDYIAAKSPLKRYVQDGLAKAGVVLHA